ncbi:MAG: LamG domain-containing protein, partial [Bacteroidia bacterium]
MKKLLFTIFLPACFFTNARAQLTASYPFNGNATDLVTGLTATVNGASLTSDRYGNPNSAYTFNGSSNISIPTGSIMTNLYTYSAWVKFATAVTGKRAVISIGDNSNTADQAMCVANGYSGQNGYVHTAYNQSSSPTDAIQGTYSVSTGVWYNIVSTKSIDTIKVYVNGALAAKAKFNGTTAGYGIAGQPKATIGSRSNNAQYFNGDIDDILIY